MKYARKVLTFHPVATKIRNSEVLEVLETVVVQNAIPDSKFRVHMKKNLKNVRIFTFGTSLETYAIPSLSFKDCLIVLIHLHCNIRFIVVYSDLSLEWGGFLVWIIFVAMHLVICPCLAFLYTFFGTYGARTFISLWDMNPLFQGLSLCMIVFEAFKMMETSLYLSSGLMSIPYYLTIGDTNSDSSTTRCERANDTFKLRPGWGTPYGFSKQFTELGYSEAPDGNRYEQWKFDSTRAQYMGLLWLVVIFIRIFQFKRYRVFPLTFVPPLQTVLCAFLMIAALASNTEPIASILHSHIKNYSELGAYLQVFAFCISDYLPCHWVTIGFLKQKESMNSLIWTMSCMKIFETFSLLLCLPYLAQNLKEYTATESESCVYLFGVHVIYVLGPLQIQRTFGKYLNTIVYAAYMLLITLLGIGHMLVSVELLTVAMCTRSLLLYRFRNLVFVSSCLGLYGASTWLCVDTVHHALFFINSKSHYLTSVVLLMLTIIGVAIYGLERINADHHFLFGCVYKHLRSTKLLFIVSTGVSIIFMADLASYKYRREDDDVIYYIFHLMCIFPFTLGIIHACGHKKSYHGVIHPLTSWGRPLELVRTARRRKNLRQMYIYRTKQECTHSCLLNHAQLMSDVADELKLRAIVLKEKLNHYNLLQLTNDAEDHQDESLHLA